MEGLPTQMNINKTEVENATEKTSGFILYSIRALSEGHFYWCNSCLEISNHINKLRDFILRYTIKTD